MKETNPEAAGTWPPRVFLRTVEVKDLCEFEGAEGDVFAIYSPRTYFITHHDEYLSKKEHEAALAKARAEVWEEMVKELDSLRERGENYSATAFKHYCLARAATTGAESEAKDG